MRTLVYIALLLAVCLSANARDDDSVRVRYFIVDARMDRSHQSTDFEITRHRPIVPPGYKATLDSAVDLYFAAIEKVLADAKISGNWERSVVHGPYVRVEISVGGKRLTLGSSYSNGAYLDGFPDSDGTNARHRAALGAILKLTAERIQDTVPKTE